VAQEFDLWGEPITPPAERRGRPSHEVTDTKRTRVAVLRALNHSAEDIAIAMNISERTLRAYYKTELRIGLRQKRAEVVVRLWEQIEKGNVSAMKEFLRQTRASDLGSIVPERMAKPPRLGKKEQAAKDARTPDPTDTLGELMIIRGDSLRQVH